MSSTADQASIRLGDDLAETLRVDRILSMLGWIASVSTTAVLGGTIYRLLVSRPASRLPPLARARYVTTGEPAAASRTATARRPAAGAAGHRTLRRLALTGILAELASVPLRAVALSGTGVAAALDLASLRFVVTSRFGDATVLRVAGLALLAGFSFPARPKRVARCRPRHQGDRQDRRQRRRAAIDRLVELSGCLVGGTVVLMSYALVGHPQATNPSYVLVPIQCVHVLAVSTWFGGLIFLAIELRQHKRSGTAPAAASIVRRFSAVAGVTVFLAGLSGLVLANSQIDSLDALLTTPYGRALLAKLAAVSVPLAIGGYNQRWLVPAVVRHDEPAAWRRLRRTVALEAIFIALGVLLATAAMTSGGF
jgi:copper transport protein